MAYVAARGGEQAIAAAEELYTKLNGPLSIDLVRMIERQLPYLVDRVMGEGSLYAPDLAALALAQTGGDLYEAVLLLRAYRSTQPRIAYALPVRQSELRTVRRISAAFKDIPGGQILGPSLDYSHRLLRLDVLDENARCEMHNAQLPATGENARCEMHNAQLPATGENAGTGDNATDPAALCIVHCPLWLTGSATRACWLRCPSAIRLIRRLCPMSPASRSASPRRVPTGFSPWPAPTPAAC